MLLEAQTLTDALLTSEGALEVGGGASSSSHHPNKADTRFDLAEVLREALSLVQRWVLWERQAASFVQWRLSGGRGAPMARGGPLDNAQPGIISHASRRSSDPVLAPFLLPAPSSIGIRKSFPQWLTPLGLMRGTMRVTLGPLCTDALDGTDPTPGELPDDQLARREIRLSSGPHIATESLAGRLSGRHSLWKHIGASGTVLSWIRHGYSIPFLDGVHILRLNTGHFPSADGAVSHSPSSPMLLSCVP